MNLKRACSVHEAVLRFFGLDVARFFFGFGVALMSISMACSKFNGKSETGFAFGMRPPMATRVVRSSLGISSEHASAVACSALRS